jgi:hypothetical protein
MTAELEELLAAAKAIIDPRQPYLLWKSFERLREAIFVFEAARDKSPAPDPYDFENHGLRKEP